MLAATLALLLFQGSSPSVLVDEPKLQKKLVVKAGAKPVGVVVERIAEQTGVPLKATALVREDLIILHSDTSARETLERIAKHFDWTWTKSEDGFYVLTQSLEQQAAEEKALEDQILMPYQRMQVAARESLRRADESTEQDAEELTRTVNDWLVEREKEHGLRESGGDLQAWSRRMGALERKKQELARKLSPSWGMTDQVIADLSRADLLELDAVGLLTVAYRPTKMQRPYSDLSTRWADKLVQTLATDNMAGLPPEEAHKLAALKIGWGKPIRAADVANVNTTILLNQPLTAEDDDASVNRLVRVRGSDGSLLAESVLSTHSLFAKAVQPPLVQPRTGLKDRLDQPLKKTGELADVEKLLASQSVGLRHKKFLSGQSDELPIVLSAQLLVEAAAAAKVNFISDCYARTWQGFVNIPVQTARGAFEAYADYGNSELTLEEPWASMRAKHWQLKRYSTPSAGNMARAAKLINARNASIDEYAEALGLLNDRMIAQPLAVDMFRQSPWRDLLAQDFASRQILRLWDSLSDSAKASLKAGGTLRYGSLNQYQQELLRRFTLQHMPGHFRTKVDEKKRYGLELDELAWMQANWPGYGVQDARRLLASEALPAGIPANAAVGMRLATVPAIAVKDPSNGHIAHYSEPEFLEQRPYRLDSTTPVRPEKQHRYTFTVWYSQQLASGVQFAANLSSDEEFLPVQQLPRDILNRLEKAHALRKIKD